MKTPSSPSPDPRDMDRREFLKRSARAGLAMGGAVALSYTLYDPRGPGASSGEAETVSLPDFSVPGTSGRLSVATGDDRAKALRAALKALGGMEAFVRPGDRVLLKVNAAFATPPALSATTHPDLVKEATRLCLEAGAASVIVTDNPINDPSSCFTLTGIGKAAQEAGAKVALPKESFFRPVTVPGGRLIVEWPLLHEPFRGIHKLIGMAPVKDHQRSGASMTMKNWYGLLGGRRNIFHQDIHNIIKELALMVKPTLVILDGVVTMKTNGPTGGSLSDLEATRTLIASTDQVAADALGATLLGKTPADLPHILAAEAAGAGVSDYESLHPARVQAG